MVQNLLTLTGLNLDKIYSPAENTIADEKEDRKYIPSSLQELLQIIVKPAIEQVPMGNV